MWSPRWPRAYAALPEYRRDDRLRDAGDTVWYSTSDNTKRKYAHTWELTKPNGRDYLR
jgi:DNA-binding sugar fermentation-stimulating protein